MRPRAPSSRWLTLGCLALAVLSGCIISRGVAVQTLAVTGSDSATVKSPVKAHLDDGSTVVFAKGATVAHEAVTGEGEHFTATLRSMGRLDSIPLGRVIGMETFRTVHDQGRTVLYSTLAAAAVLAGGVALACASDPKCFGSCPTFYADSAGVPVLEAEGFSYSIAPLLEARDIDRLRTQPDSAGIVRLQVWNEALETHYINNLALVEATHHADEMVLPDEHGRPVAVSNYVRMLGATDRAGRDVGSRLERADGVLFSTDSATLGGVSAGDMDDHIDLTFPRPVGSDSVAIVLRMRNSLLNTILFYDYMLARPGARSLDWMENDLGRIGPTVALGKWYNGKLGMRVSVKGPNGWEQVTKLSDYGPIAWRDVAAVIPTSTSGDSMHVRIAFLADQWRIDRLAVATSVRRVPTRTIDASDVEGAANNHEAVALEAIGAADEDYLETSPRQRFTVSFDVGRSEPGKSRTFLLVSQGYYTEWVRGGWLTGKRDTSAFKPEDATLLSALQSWRAQKDSMEKQFYRSRIPVQ
ncbi:MAG: hypothetical protein ACJ79K_17945 [Gemmatimonadaceae bacterium]